MAGLVQGKGEQRGGEEGEGTEKGGVDVTSASKPRRQGHQPHLMPLFEPWLVAAFTHYTELGRAWATTPGRKEVREPPGS